MEHEQQTTEYAPMETVKEPKEKKPRPLVSTGAAIILSIALIIVAVIIAAVVMVSSGAKVISDLDIDLEAIEGLDVEFEEREGGSTVNIDIEHSEDN